MQPYKTRYGVLGRVLGVGGDDLVGELGLIALGLYRGGLPW